MAKIIVAGGGFAGVAAATALAEQGHRVELLESRGFLGGRVYSTPATDAFPAPVDNGPHLFMGCYHETLHLLERLGVPDPFHWIDPLKILWFSRGGKKLSLQCAPLPAPLHLVWGLFTSNAFSWTEKMALTRALGRFSKKPFNLNPTVETVAQFLDSTHQGPQTRERFWIPLCNAVMNVSIESAPIQGLGEVLCRIFFGARRDSAFAVAAKPLSEMGFSQVGAFLEKKGGSVFFHEGVQSFSVNSASFEVVTRSQKRFTGDALIWAVPPSSLAALWPKGTWPAADNLSQLGKSPIVSVHVIVSQSLIQGHFAGLPGARFEWVFNRNANWDWKGEGQSQYLSFTASAAADLALLKDPELLDLALLEWRERCPSAKDLSVLHSKVTREMAATFIWNPKTNPFRLPCETPFSNVFLAGDWTATGLPATIEGACQSGHQAAEKVADYLRKNS
jgi:squalene-associated FAD-dependent desaturase